MFTFFNDFDSEHAAQRLRTVGAVRIPRGLKPTYRQGLLDELARHPTNTAAPIVGAHDTVQCYRFVTCFPDHSIARTLMDECGRLIRRAFGRLTDNPLLEPLWFNDPQMHWYPPSDIGVGFHRDGARYRGLIAIVMLRGDGQFLIGKTHGDKPETALRIVAVPGDMILMRARGFDGVQDESHSPLHGVYKIHDHRATLSFRSNRNIRPRGS